MCIRDSFKGLKVRPIYSRGLNPTVQQLEMKLAALEATDEAIGFASGMAAISSTVLSFLKPGERMICVRHVYPDAYRLFETLLRRWNIAVTYVDGADQAAVEAALPGATLLYLESPTSWMMQAHDVAALAALARKHHVLSVIDNSWACLLYTSCSSPARNERPFSYRSMVRFIRSVRRLSLIHI